VEEDALDAYARVARALAGLDDGQRPAGIVAANLVSAAERAEARSRRSASEAYSAWTKGRRLLEDGRIAAAVAELERGARFGSRRFGAWVLLDLAVALRLAGEWTEALDAFAGAERALTGDTAEAEAARVAVHGEKGQMLADLGLLDLGHREFERETEAAAGLGAPARLGAVLHRVAYDLAVMDFSGAAERARAALEEPDLIAAHASARGSLLLLRGIAESRLARADRDGLLAAASTLGAALGEAAMDGPTRLRAEVSLAWVETALGRLEDSERLLRAASERAARLEKPQETAEIRALEGRVARERAPGGGLRPFLDASRGAYRRVLDEWASVPLRPGGIGFLHFADRRRVLSELILLAIAAEGAEIGARAALDDLLAAQALGSIARSAALEPGSLESARSRLTSASTGLLVYLPAPERSHLFVIDPALCVHVALAPSFEIERRVDDVSAATEHRPARTRDGSIDGADVERAAAAARKLADLLIPAEIRETVASWSAVRIVGADLLGWPAFECLPLAGDRPLGFDLAVSYLPSIPLGISMTEKAGARRPRSAEGLDLCVVAAPLAGAPVAERWPSLAPVRLDEIDGERLLEPFAPDRRRSWTGAEATKLVLADQAVASARVLNILAHGVRVDDRERPVHLVLSPSGEDDDGLLGCDEVEALRVPPIVLLSACGAARGPLRRGDEGIGHLGGAFLKAGASAVILSRADLDLEATVSLVAAFNRSLAGLGRSPAEALRDARREVAGRPRFAHPYYFALLHLVGLGDVRLFPEGGEESPLVPALRAIAAGAAIAVGAACVVALRRRRSRAKTTAAVR